MIITFAVVWRVTKLTPKLFVFWRSILASLIMGYALYIFSAYHFLILLLGSALIYSFLLYSLGAIKKETLREMLSTQSS